MPLLAGNNARERTPRRTPEELTKAIEAMYGPLAPRAFALYPTKLNSSEKADTLYGDAAAQWVVDTMYRCPVVAELSWHAAAGNPAWEYQFDRAAPGRESVGSVHGTEVPYVFGTLEAKYSAVDRGISEVIQEYWTNFAKTGNPNAAKLTAWKRFTDPAKNFLVVHP